MRIAAALLAIVVLAGCVSSQVRNGATIGAISGAAAGAGVGLLISDEDLLGSGATPEKGDTSLAVGPTTAASALIGVVFGAIVGGMVGHVNEPHYGRGLDGDAGEDANAAPMDAPEGPAQEGARAPMSFRF